MLEILLRQSSLVHLKFSLQPILFILEEFETFLTSQGKSYASMQSKPYEIKGMEFDTKLEGKNHLGGES